MINASFQWKCEPQAEEIALRLLGECTQHNHFLNHLGEELYKKTSTRLFDWVDHLLAPESKKLSQELHKAGFIEEERNIFHHPGAQLPRIVLTTPAQTGVALVVDSIANFLMVHHLTMPCEGTPYSGYRKALVSEENHIAFYVVERRGTLTLEPTQIPPKGVLTILQALEAWKTRPRALDDLEPSLKLAKKLVASLGQDLAAWVVCEVEREYWQSKNKAGQLQKARQDYLGMGWANHDHHTFRSSRRNFAKLVALFELLGFQSRERFYAGKEAGWGAQIMENPRARLVLFLDVDLTADEIGIDFAHQPLPQLKELGTVGLWCALHGDSILQGGMHHLEAQFMFSELTEELSKKSVRMMDPFSDFPYLKQAFTEGEVWAVDPKRVDQLQALGSITAEQAEKFKAYGAVGSHLENLQRREGYKGFNQKNVSFIIQKTDPRKI